MQTKTFTYRSLCMNQDPRSTKKGELYTVTDTKKKKKKIVSAPRRLHQNGEVFPSKTGPVPRFGS